MPGFMPPTASYNFGYPSMPSMHPGHITPSKKLEIDGLLGFGRGKPQAIRPVFVPANLEKTYVACAGQSLTAQLGHVIDFVDYHGCFVAARAACLQHNSLPSVSARMANGDNLEFPFSILDMLTPNAYIFELNYNIRVRAASTSALTMQAYEKFESVE